jgi:hypothetical protein
MVGVQNVQTFKFSNVTVLQLLPADRIIKGNKCQEFQKKIIVNCLGMCEWATVVLRNLNTHELTHIYLMIDLQHKARGK